MENVLGFFLQPVRRTSDVCSGHILAIMFKQLNLMRLVVYSTPM